MRLLLTMLLLLVSAAAQQSAVGFVSPNVRDTMNYADAKASLSSWEQTNFLAVEDRILCSLAENAHIDSGIGEVHEKGRLGIEGAENSTVLRAQMSFEEMKYALALLGRYAHQEYVIAFGVDPTIKKPARVFTLHAGKQFDREAIEKALDSAGVLHRTIVDDHTVIAFVMPDDSDVPVRRAGQQLRAFSMTEEGRGELIGNDDRLKAAAIYDHIIAEFEAAHPASKLSAKLWSAEWHDAVTRTCTTIP